MPMPNRQMVGGELYRYAYQGQEKDPETGKEAFQLRLWDGRIGRWLTTDPAGQYSSPYLGMGNNPISRVDPDGGSDCPNPPCSGVVNPLNEIVITGKGNNRSGYEPTMDDYAMLKQLRRISFSLYNQVNKRYKSGDYFKLTSNKGYWGDFGNNFKAGASNWKKGDIGYDLQRMTAFGIGAPLLMTNPVSVAVFTKGSLKMGIDASAQYIITGDIDSADVLISGISPSGLTPLLGAFIDYDSRGFHTLYHGKDYSQVTIDLVTGYTLYGVSKYANAVLSNYSGVSNLGVDLYNTTGMSFMGTLMNYQLQNNN